MSADAAMLRSQHGEDALLAEFFHEKRNGVFVEVGALDGEVLSNTYYFERKLGWHGVLVEANPEQARACAATRTASRVVNIAATRPGAAATITLNVAVGDGNAGYSTLSANRTYAGMLRDRGITTIEVEVPTATMDEILGAAPPDHIDFMTIDVEGHERDVLRGLDLRRWMPTVILLESAGGAPNVFVAWQLFRAGYARTRRIVINDWYETCEPPRRTALLLWSYIASVPDLVRAIVRESLREVGLLDHVRRWRGARIPRGRH